MEIINSSQVVSFFGYWPKFCDARVIEFKLLVGANHRCSIELGLCYIDVEKARKAEIELLFENVLSLNISNIFDENIIDELFIEEKDNSGFQIKIESCYGMSGTFGCEKIKVQKIKADAT